jgi:iron(III) transport system substrate-binding protein
MTTERDPGAAPTSNRRRQVLVAGLLASLPLASIAADNQALLQRAREEARQGKFQIMVSAPKGEKAHAAIMEAFQKRFDIKLDWEWVPLTSAVSAPRLLEQSRSSVRLPSVVSGYSYENYGRWIAANGLALKVDWVEEFGSMLPAIKVAAHERVLPAQRNWLVRQWDAQFVIVYNTGLLKPHEVPADVAELTEPKWRGRFAMSNIGASPLDVLALDHGTDKSLDIARKLVANQPRFKPGPPAVVGAIVNGEVAVGVSGYTSLAEAQRKKGAPIAWVPMDRLPIYPLFGFVMKQAPQPTLGKLFLAWLVTEGLPLQEREEELSTFWNAESPTTRAIKAARPGIKPLEIRNEQDEKLVETTAREIQKILAGVSGK